MKTSFANLINSETPVLIDFYADWCAPCRMMAPILEELKKQLGDKVKIVKIDTEKNREISAQLDIRSIPTLVLFHKGKAVWRQSGVVPSQTIASAITQFAN
jgi:thioredoxin 1